MSVGVPAISGLSQVAARQQQQQNTSSSSSVNISTIPQTTINKNNNDFSYAPPPKPTTDVQQGEYKDWMQQAHRRLEKYRHLATTSEVAANQQQQQSSSSPLVSNGNVTSNRKSPQNRAATPSPSSSSFSNQKKLLSSSNSPPKNAPSAAKGDLAGVSDEQLVQMTRREIEVLAAYHCELQRMIRDQDEKIDMMYDELASTHEMAERLQVEVEKKTGGGVSPRRQAKMAMRQEIVATRRIIDDTHNELLQLQSELDGVRTEHSDVRQFISRQFFPVKQVTPEQKWPPTCSNTSPYHPAQIGNQLIVRPTKTADLREQIIRDRKRGFVPGTTIKSTTHGVTEVSETRKKRRTSMATTTMMMMSSSSAGGESPLSGRSGATVPGVSWESYCASAQRVKHIQEGKLPASIVGHLSFRKKDIVRESGVFNNMSTKNTGGQSNVNDSNNHNNHSYDYSLSSRDPTFTTTTKHTNDLSPPMPAHHSAPRSSSRAKSSSGFSSSSTMNVGAASSTSALPQERSVRSKRDSRPPFRRIPLCSTSPSQGIVHHGDPGNYEGY